MGMKLSLVSSSVMPTDIDLKPREKLLSVCVVDTDGLNISPQIQNTSTQLTSVLGGMHFNHDCADAGRQSWGVL